MTILNLPLKRISLRAWFILGTTDLNGGTIEIVPSVLSRTERWELALKEIIDILHIVGPMQLLEEE